MSSVFWFTFSDMERRLTAILAADVVGYSRLMGANESGTLATLDALRTDFVNPKISEHQGRIVKLTGDGMLVEFPSVVNAVACAAELQRGIRKQNAGTPQDRSEEHTSELQSLTNLVCRLLLEKKKQKNREIHHTNYTPRSDKRKNTYVTRES